MDISVLSKSADFHDKAEMLEFAKKELTKGLGKYLEI